MITSLIYLTFFLFSLGQLGRVSIIDGQVNFYLYEVALVILLLLFFFKLKLKPIGETFKKFKTVYYFVGYVVLSFVLTSLSFSPIQNAVGFLYLLRLLFYLTLPLYLYFFLKQNPKYEKVLKKGLMFFLVITVASSLIQYIFYPDLRNLYYLGWDPHLNRLFSVFFDTSLAAAVFGLIFFYLYRNKNYWLALPYLAFLVLTFSRAAYLAFGVTFLISMIGTRQLKKGLLLLLLAAMVFVLAPKQFGLGVGLDRMFSISSRLADYQKGIAMWQKSPIVGYGYNRLAYVKERMNLEVSPKENIPVHSAASLSGSFLIVLVTTGILGFVLFIGSISQLIRENREAVLYFLFLVLLSLTDNILIHPFILFLMGVIYAIILPSGRSRLKS